MHTKASIHLLLCLLIVGAHVHCVLAHGAALIGEVEASRCAEPPIGERNTCENESSCICKGALVSRSFPPFLKHADRSDWLSSPDQRVDGSSLALQVDQRHILPVAAILPSGAFARIVLQSFQI